MLLIEKCPFCEGRNVILIHKTFQKEVIRRYYRCNDCGYVEATDLEKEKETELFFQELAEESPQRLIEIVELIPLEVFELSCALENFNFCRKDDISVKRLLLKHLDHQSPMVREAAIFGISAHISDDVYLHLKDMSENDSSAEVREAAKDASETYFKENLDDSEEE